MICPHCNTAVNTEYFDESEVYNEGNRTDYWRFVSHGECPQCHQVLILLFSGKTKVTEQGREEPDDYDYKIVYPPNNTRKVEPEVPEIYKKDFLEAVAVLNISPKASAALSRRVLQNVLRGTFNINKKNLALEIQDFIGKKDIPSYLSDAVDAVRVIGNFAAHPMKETNTGEIVDVEPGEAEWLLEVLESLFDFAFVQPKRLEIRKKELDKKLKSTKNK